MTFRSDGTGAFEGPFTAATAWAIQGEAICVSIKLPMSGPGKRCVRFSKTAAGLQAYENGVPAFTLKR